MALMVKNLPDNAGDARDVGLISGSGRFPGVENGNPVQPVCAACWVASIVSDSVTPWTVACQVPLPMRILQGRGYWSGFSCPPPGDLPDPGIEPTSLMFPALWEQSVFFITEPVRKPPLQCTSQENSLDRRSLDGYSPGGCKELDMTECLSRK